MSYTQSYVVNSSSAQGTTDFQFTFPYIKEAHIEVYLDYTKLTQGTGSNQYAVITNVSPKLIRLNTGTTSANRRVEVRRNSSLGTPLVDYADGSTLTANDLDTSALQSLYIDQELKDNQTKTVSVDESTGLPSLGESGTNLRLTKVADPTSAQDAVTKAYLERAGSISSTQILDGTILNADVNASAAIAGSKLQASSSSNAGSMSAADKAKLDGIDTGATNDQTAAEIRALVESASDSNVFTDADHTKLNDIDTGAKDDQTAAEIRALVESATDSNVFTDADHSKLNAIDAGAKDDQTAAEIRALVESATDSNVFTDTDHSRLNAIEDNATADQTAAEIKTAYESNSDTNALTDNEKAVIDGVTANTSELNKLDGATASTTELNIVAGKTFRASGDGTLTTTSDTEIPSSKVIASHVSSAVGNVGGFTVIANDASFPATASQPANGIVVSINDAAGVVVNGSGTSTTGRTTDGTPATVTINGFPSSLNSETLASGVGMQVVSTGSSNTYNYHKILASENDVKSLSDDINDFNARYRVASSAPSSNNDDGDLYFDTSANKMKVYNATTSTWDDVASVGNFYINTISSSSGTGGGSATFNGSAYRFTLSNPPTMAQQLIVSVNGVTQKPNAGTSQPGEGFAVDGNDIVFSSAPASGSDFFIVTQGSSVSIGTPSDNTVTTGKIVDGSITNAKVSNSAAIVGSKLADDSIVEAKLDIHQAPADGKYLKYTSSNGMEWADGASEGTDVKSTGESGTTKFLRVDGDGTSSWQVPPDTVYTHPNHSGEVTSTADGATVIADDVVDEANLKASNAPTNGQFLQAQSGNTGGLTWATANQYTHPNHSGEVTSTGDGATVIAGNVVDEANLKVSNSPTNGQLLSAQSGNTGGLTWTDPVSPGWVKVDSGQAVSGTDIEIYDGFEADTYICYKIMYFFTVGGGGGGSQKCQLGNSGGYITSSTYISQRWYGEQAYSRYGSFEDNGLILPDNTSRNAGEVTIYDPNYAESGGGVIMTWTGMTATVSTGDYHNKTVGGFRGCILDTDSAMTKVRFKFDQQPNRFKWTIYGVGEIV